MKNDNEHTQMRYCSIIKCPHVECLRHYSNVPYGVIVKVVRYDPDKDWNCEDILL